MKKFFLSFAIFTASAVYAAYQYVGDSNTAPTAQTSINAIVTAPITQSSTTPNTNSISNGQTVQSPSPTPSTPTTPTPAPKQQGQYADGTYSGSSADAYYGFVQVQATVQGGRLTDVAFLQYPNDRRTSQRINSQAMPLLRQEAIQVQSANVSGVSGASDTSVAFRESLASALAQAKN